MPKDNPILNLLDLTLILQGEKRAKILLDHLNIQLKPGKITLLTGKTGSGKTLTAHCVMRLLNEPRFSLSGQILFQGVDLLQLSDREMQSLRGKEIAMMFQDPLAGFNPILRLGPQIEEALRLQPGISRREAKRQTMEWIASMKLTPKEKYYRARPSEVSGGELQRLMLALAMIRRPKLLLLDEPTSSLDTPLKHTFIRLLQDLISTHNTTTLLITHDVHTFLPIADEVYILEKGKCREHSAIWPTPPSGASSSSTPGLTPLRPVKSTPQKETHSPVLELRNLTAGYYDHLGRKRDIIRNFNLRLNPGTCIGITGPSGVGKTTLALGITGLADYCCGQVRLAGVDLSSLNRKELRQHRTMIQMIWQNPLSSLNPHQTVGQTLLLALKMRRPNSGNPSLADLLHWVDLDQSVMHVYPSQLSGGQQQRVCIARALALNPSVLLCDEPVASLDSITQTRILTLIQTIQRQLNLSILLISHDEEVLRCMADQIIVLEEYPADDAIG